MTVTHGASASFDRHTPWLASPRVELTTPL
jgi:hypothetical protein